MHWTRKLARIWPTMFADRLLLSCWIWILILAKAAESARHQPIPSPVCTFESPCPQWQFLNSDQLAQQQQQQTTQNGTTPSSQLTEEKEPNFRVVLSGGGNASNHYAYYQAMLPSAAGQPPSPSIVPMLVSASFFERTSAQCELHFRYRVLGARGAELLVATEQLSLRLLHPPEMGSAAAGLLVLEEEDEDWTRPTLRARFEPGNPPLAAGQPWAQARLPLGQFNFPTRIRVECHPSTELVQLQQSHQNPAEEEEEEVETTLSVECSVDDLQMVNCAEERWRLAGSAEGVDCPEGRIPCRPLGARAPMQICLRDDQLCDMHPDCADGEDELEQLHRCSQVPDGARCDFEDLRWLPAACAHWRFFSSQAGGQAKNSSSSSAAAAANSSPPGPMLQHLVSLADAQTSRRAGIPPAEYSLEGRLYRPGHFLFFSSYDHAQSGQHDIVYSFALSPALPAFQSAGLLRHCSLRFFYCQTGFSPFQVFLQRRDQPQELAKPLWAPPRDDHVREPCEWRRAAVHVETASLAPGAEYSLKLSFAKLAGSLGSIAVDDLSLSPECFANGARSSLLPAKLSIGFEEQGTNGESADSEKESGALLRWIVPSSGEYRLELSGAAGGSFPATHSPNSRRTFADRLVANLRLNAGQQIGVLLGQRGECICDRKWAQLRGREQAHFRDQLCAKGPGQPAELATITTSSLPGCAGGGASLFFVGTRPWAVAAGGGGDFPVQPILLSDAEKQKPTSAELESRAAGRGLSLNWHLAGNASYSQQRCAAHGTGSWSPACMDGHVGGNLSQLLGGKCQRDGFGWTMAGGKGGGGAVCGSGWAGGGAGYEGGAAGHQSAGQPGTSVFLASQSPAALLVLRQSHSGQGQLRLVACPQRECPANSNCTFGVPREGEEDGEEEAGSSDPQPKCICAADGRVVPLNGSCQLDPSLLDRLLAGANGFQQSPATQESIPVLLLIACLLLLLFSLLLCLLCCLQFMRFIRRRQKLLAAAAGCPSADVHELMAIAAESGGPAAGERGGHGHYGISGNPIYESLNLNPLPQIPRHALRLENIIGHGAFGEVFEGWLYPTTATAANQQQQLQGEEKPIKVAVKSLPVESARDFGDDFETEARLLSQFKHENIVTFFGVSFEQQPKYIVLEFLEGGDLKKFLRENRPRQDQQQQQQQQDPPLRMGDLLGFALDVARGGEHLEATRFVHRDIAARNCLLTAKVGRRVVKIADFGMARDIYRNDYYRKGGKAFLPVRWMPPESFLDGLFTSKTDVWAFGVLLWEIFSLGYIPYSGRENHEVMRLVVAGDRLDPPIGIPAEVYELMLCCWNTEAESRPMFAELVRTFEALLAREDLCAEPLPPVRYRLANERSVSATPSMSRAGDPHPASTTSQATVSTALSSAPEAATLGGGGSTTTTSGRSYESMPTAGDGVCRAVFPPYQSRQPDEGGLIRLEEPERAGAEAPSSSSGSGSSGSQDETLHESAGTVKLRNCIVRRPPPPLTLKPLSADDSSTTTARAGRMPVLMPTAAEEGKASMQKAAAPGPWQQRPSNNNAGHFSTTASPTTPQHHHHQLQANRNQSLPPLPTFGAGSLEQHRQGGEGGEGDQDSGIASARSIASADAALTLLGAALESRERRPEID